MRGGEVEGGAASGGLLLMNMMAGMDKLARQEAGHHPKESVKVCLLAVMYVLLQLWTSLCTV